MRNLMKGKGELWALLGAGLAAGFLNGLLGAGGGIAVVLAVNKLFKEGTDKNTAFATALCVMLPVSLLSVALYSARGSMNVSGFGVFILPAVLGGALGGLLLGRLKTVFLKKLFAALVVVSGILLIVR